MKDEVLKALRNTSQSLVFFDSEETPINSLDLSPISIIKIMEDLRVNDIVKYWSGFTPSGWTILKVTSCVLNEDWLVTNCPKSKRFKQLKLFEI